MFLRSIHPPVIISCAHSVCLCVILFYWREFGPCVRPRVRINLSKWNDESALTCIYDADVATAISAAADASVVHGIYIDIFFKKLMLYLNDDL